MHNATKFNVVHIFCYMVSKMICHYNGCMLEVVLGYVLNALVVYLYHSNKNAKHTMSKVKQIKW